MSYLLQRALSFMTGVIGIGIMWIYVQRGQSEAVFVGCAVGHVSAAICVALALYGRQP